MQKSLLIAATLVLGAGAASAQAPESAPHAVAPLIVEGAAQPKVIKQRAWTFVQAYTASGAKNDLLGRWRDPICVDVVNLAPEQAAMVKGRIEEVAREVGLQISRPGCRSNIQIVLTGQPQAFVDQVAKNNENALGFHYPEDLPKVKAVIHPIQGWYKTATESSKFSHDGLPFANLTTGIPGTPSSAPTTNVGSLKGEAHAPETVDIPENGSPPGCAGSLINHCERSVFKNVLVVVDSHAVEGKGLGPMADYLTMMALSQAKSLDGCAALPSIFDLMAKSSCPGRDPPDGITAADASFLTALYAANPEARAVSEQADIANRMAAMLINATPSDKAKRGASPQGRKGG